MPGAVERYDIDLGPIAAVFARGHRLRLQVSSSDFPLWDRNLNVFTALASADLAVARVATQQILHRLTADPVDTAERRAVMADMDAVAADWPE